jgi:predicted nuclease of predicted toxin-antitoxin system
MSRILANENVPGDVVNALGMDGHDVTWMRLVGPGSPDDQVLALAFAEGRIVLTFDKDFGELAFRLGQRSSPGVILLRPRLRSPDHLVRFTRAVLAQGHSWEGHFAVAEEGRLRLVPLPT